MISTSWTTDGIPNLTWSILLSAGMAACASPWGRRLAWAIGAIDQPNPRKIHQHATARLGGLSVATALLACICLWLLADPMALDQCARYWGLFPAATMMFLVGLWDDVNQIRPQTKLMFQCLAAGIIYCGGIRIDAVELPFVGAISLGWAGMLFTMFWIVGIINAFNFLDGLDGLAAGTAALASSGFLLISGFAAMGGILGLLSMVLIGASIVLMVNNFRSPKLFLGDSGSLLLGILIAAMTILSAQFVPHNNPSVANSTRLCLPAIILAVPLVDMLACAARRLLVGRSIFAADRGHIHHMLLTFGFSHGGIVAILCSATAFFGILAAVAARGPAWVEAAAVAIVIVLSLLVYRKFGYLSLAMWLHCRRANRVLDKLLKQLSHPEPQPRIAAEPIHETEQRLEHVCRNIRRARRALGIEYVLIQKSRRSSPQTVPSNILELGEKPNRLVTSRLYSCTPPGIAELTVTYGDGSQRQPAKIHAREQLLMPLLLELADALRRSDTGVRNLISQNE